MRIRSMFAALSLLALGIPLGGCNGGSASDADPSSSESDVSRSRFTDLKGKASNKHVQALYDAASKIEQSYIDLYRFNRVTTEATDSEARINRGAEVMHRYMCPFFDEGVAMGLEASAKKRASVVMSDLDAETYMIDLSDADKAAFEKAVEDVAADPDLEFVSGTASGNNTSANVASVYDIKTNEILAIGFTNCGSDS